MKNKILLLATLLSVCSFSCKKEAEKKSEEQQMKPLSERDLAGLRLWNMLHNKDFEQALQ